MCCRSARRLHTLLGVKSSSQIKGKMTDVVWFWLELTAMNYLTSRQESLHIFVSHASYIHAKEDSSHSHVSGLSLVGWLNY